MSKSRVAALCAIGILGLCAGAVAAWWALSSPALPPPAPAKSAQADREDRDTDSRIFVEYNSPRTLSLADLVTNADAVLTVLLDNDRVRQIDEPIHPQTERGIPPVAMSFSVYEFKVLASVKGGPRTGDRIRIARYGRRGDYEPDFPRPGVGEQFLVFLKWSRRLDAFEHLYGRVAFRIVSGDVQSMDYRLRRASGQRLDDVLAVLRRSLPGAEGPRR